MKKIIVLTSIVVVAAMFSGCAYNAKEETPGTQWKHAAIVINDTNGFSASAIIDNYNSKKDVQFSVNPVTHTATLGSVMNPSNTIAAAQAIAAQGVANVNQITVTGQAAVNLAGAIGQAVGQAAGAAVKTP